MHNRRYSTKPSPKSSTKSLPKSYRISTRGARWLTGVAILIVSSATLLLGSRQAVDDDFFAIQKNFEIFGSMFEALVGTYVDPVDAERLMRRGISAMLEELDPYTVFIDEADYSAANVQRTGRLGTVGLDLDYRNGNLTVLSPVDGGAAFRQGIRVGDVIQHVDGRDAADLTRNDVLELLSGEPGSTVRVGIRRTGDDDIRTFTLVREVLRHDAVAHAGFLFGDVDQAVAYVRLANFNPGSSERVAEELNRMAAVAEPRAIILDLRDNQGGLLDAAVAITQLFVPSGTPVVSVRGRRPETYADFRTSGQPKYPDTPLFVLVNRNSASSSEIVAGAIQDLDRGIIIGETSFGKGLAQHVLALPFNTGVKITTSRFYSPSGRNVQSANYRIGGAPTPDSLRQTFATRNGRPIRDGGGIEPDVAVTRLEPGPLESALLQHGMFARYADENSAEFVGDVDSYTINDVDLDAFAGWLSGRAFSYRTDAEQLLDALSIELNTAVGNEAGRGPAGGRAGGAATADAIASIQGAIERQKQAAFDVETEALRRALFDAIAARASTGSDQLFRTRTRYDLDIQEALRLLNDPATRDAILGS